jgi:Methyltransferase domain
VNLTMRRLARSIVRSSVRTVRRVPSLRHVIDAEVTGPVVPDRFRLANTSLSVGNDLDAIPSQTTTGERRLLYQFFRTLWTGRNDVVEIGPFLGGTSRAIAMGMLRNPRRLAGTKLYTFDRFQEYFEVDRLREYLQPLVDRKILTKQQIDDLGERAPFINVFRAVHESHDYYQCLQPSDNGVPDLPEQVNEGPWMSLADGFKTDAVFIDGCKSWYGTKYFMKMMAPVAQPGATFLFQDYGWFTCFWLAAFVETFSEHFSLIGSVDNTYVFCLDKRLDADTIESRFADSPQDAGKERLVELLDRQIDGAAARGDSYAVIRHTIHKAGALAYVGEPDAAKNVLSSVDGLPNAHHHRTVIRRAWESPTYTPQAPVLL